MPGPVGVAQASTNESPARELSHASGTDTASQNDDPPMFPASRKRRKLLHSTPSSEGSAREASRPDTAIVGSAHSESSPNEPETSLDLPSSSLIADSLNYPALQTDHPSPERHTQASKIQDTPVAPGPIRPPSPPFYLIAVHGGAGAHSRSDDTAVKRALRDSITTSLPLLTNATTGDRSSSPMSSTALQASTHAISSLEDSEPLNSGYGSNLTMTGHVECDASVMDGLTSNFGAVGAIGGGVKNPIRVASRVCEMRGVKDRLGRVMPVMLVGRGAEEFARKEGMEVCSGEEEMVSQRARREWQVWRRRLEEAESGGFEEKREETLEQNDGEGVTGLNARQDTVGAVVSDGSGNLAAGVSR